MEGRLDPLYLELVSAVVGGMGRKFQIRVRTSTRYLVPWSFFLFLHKTS